MCLLVSDKPAHNETVTALFLSPIHLGSHIMFGKYADDCMRGTQLIMLWYHLGWTKNILNLKGDCRLDVFHRNPVL